MLLLVFQGKYIVIGYWHSLLKFMESWSEVEVKHCMWRVVYWNYDWCSLMISVVHNHALKVAACSYTIGPIQMVLYRKMYFECTTIALMIYDDIYIYTWTVEWPFTNISITTTFEVDIQLFFFSAVRYTHILSWESYLQPCQLRILLLLGLQPLRTLLLLR